MEQFNLLDQINKNLTSKRVGIIEWAESDEYCNKHLYPRQRLLLKLIYLEELTGKEEDLLDYWIKGARDGKEITISPKIRERIEYLRGRSFPHFREVVLVGGRRSSKGFLTGICLAKKMHDLMQLQNPGAYYRIDENKEIYFSCIASSLEQAKKYQYSDFINTVSTCEAMVDNIFKQQELEFSVMTEGDKARLTLELRKQRSGRKGQSRDSSKLRGVALAANAASIRGSATIALAFDEMAHMQQEGESAQTAEQVYEAAVPALSQFGKDALIFLNSSPYTKIGKFYNRYEDAMKVEDGEIIAPTMFTLQYPSWALYEGYQYDEYTPWHPQKHISTGGVASPDWDPDEKMADGSDLWSEKDKDSILEHQDKERQDPDNFKVEYRSQWAEIIDAFLRPEMVDRAYAGRPARDGSRTRMKTNWDNSSYVYKYRAHLDPSSTTAGFGFAMGHIEELEEVNSKTGELINRSHVMFDIVQRWEPDKFAGGAVDWEVVLKEVTRYIVIFRPYEVTFDQFQSQAPIQWLNKWLREQNMQDVRVYEKPATAQYNWNRAEVFRTALYQDLVHIPSDTAHAQWSNLELKNLQQVNSAGRYPRVDKQDIGPVRTKDMADCLMEVTDALIGNLVASQIRASLGMMAPELGAPGGYRIGGEAGKALASLYSGNKGMNTFKEMRPSKTVGGGTRSSARQNLDKIMSTRSGTWSRRHPGSGGGRSRGY